MCHTHLKKDGGRKERRKEKRRVKKWGGRKEESKERKLPIYIDSLCKFNLSDILLVANTCYLHSTYGISGLNFKTFNIYIFEVDLLF